MDYFDQIPISDYPPDYIPAGAEIFIAVDQASPDGDCTVKGFYDPNTGKYHIQSVEYSDTP